MQVSKGVLSRKSAKSLPREDLERNPDTRANAVKHNIAWNLEQYDTKLKESLASGESRLINANIDHEIIGQGIATGHGGSL